MPRKMPKMPFLNTWEINRDSLRRHEPIQTYNALHARNAFAEAAETSTHASDESSLIALILTIRAEFETLWVRGDRV